MKVRKRKRIGLDWGDRNIQESFLERNGSQSTDDPDLLIAVDVQKEIADMSRTDAGKTSGFALDVPSIEDITDCCRNGKPLHVSAEYRHGDNGEQMDATWFPKNRILNLSYLYGDHEADISYETVRETE